MLIENEISPVFILFFIPRALAPRQKDIEDPTHFLKSYLEVASGTGKEFDKLKQIFVELFSALFKVDSAVARVGAELKGAKEFIENELNEIKVCNPSVG